MLRLGRRRSPAHAALLDAAGVADEVPILECSLSDALTAARLGALSNDAAADLDARPPGALPPHALTTPGGLGPRAEAAGIAALFRALDEADAGGSPSAAAALARLREGAAEAAQAGSPRRAVEGSEAPCTAGLMAWAAAAGIEASAITPACFQMEGGGGEGTPPSLIRGVAAARPITPGDPFLTIPAAALITPASAAATDLGKALWSLPGVSADDALLAWTMVDAADTDSPRSPIWAALRAAPVCTGLTISDAAAAVLDGTPVGRKLHATRRHVRAAFEASRPLFTALSRFVDDPQTVFSWPSYAWAASVWYAFAMEVQGVEEVGEAATTTTPALVPVAFLLNHAAAHPTAVRYGALERLEDGGDASGNASTRVMRVRACAPAGVGGEVTLSYGARSNADLLVFYGFAVPENPDDALELEVGGGASEGGAALTTPARDFAGEGPLGPGPGLVAAARAAAGGGGEGAAAAARLVVEAAALSAAAHDAAADRARRAAAVDDVEAEEDRGWLAAAAVAAEGGAALARAVVAAVGRRGVL